MRRLLIVLVLVLTVLKPMTETNAEPRFSPCLLPPASWSLVSLGSPLAPERLGNKSRIRVGILPFYHSDSKVSNLTAAERDDYLSAAAALEKLSNGLVKVEIVFLKAVSSKIPYQRSAEMVLDKKIGWDQWDLTKSTYGVVKETIKNVDSEIDFSNLDSVILVGVSDPLPGGVAEAFQFFRAQPNLMFIKKGIEAGYNFSFHESIKTQEGMIDNAILLDRSLSVSTITHELLHNFGLTDLYGSSASPNSLSIMSSNVMKLLNYERAVLGWLPIDQIKCYNLNEFMSRSVKDSIISFEDIEKEEIIILKISNQEAYLLEVLPYSGKRLMIIYKLNMESRPPIEMISKEVNGAWVENVTTFSTADIGKSLSTNEFSLIFSNKLGRAAYFNIVSKSKLGSEEFANLSKETSENRDRALSIELAAAESKAKADAEAKAAAERAQAEAKSKNEEESKAKVATDSKKATIAKTATITCINGKFVKKVTSTNPKCPKGFKKK